MQTIELKIGGMHCGSCSMLIQLSVDELPGIDEAVADYGSGTARVTFDPSRTSVEQIVQAIHAAGYSAELA